MRHQSSSLLLALWLATVTAFIGWFDYAALVAVFHPSSDAAGNLLFAVVGYSNTVYPFTYVGVGLSCLGCAWFIYRQERRDRRRAHAALIGVAVANIASVGMVDVYEQVWVFLNYLSPHGHGGWTAAAIRFYWGTAGGVAGTFAGLLIVLTVLPWASKQNWPGVAFLVSLFGVLSLVWLLDGYLSPPQGDSLDYWLNALTRVSSQLVLVAAVAPRDFLRFLVRYLSQVRQEFGARRSAG
jgi:hypothetical protein